MGLWCTIGPATPCIRIIADQVMFGMGGAGFALPLPMLASVPHVHNAGLASGLVMTVRLRGGFNGLTIGSNLHRSTDSLGTQLPESLRGRFNSLSTAGSEHHTSRSSGSGNVSEQSGQQA